MGWDAAVVAAGVGPGNEKLNLLLVFVATKGPFELQGLVIHGDHSGVAGVHLQLTVPLEFQANLLGVDREGYRDLLEFTLQQELKSRLAEAEKPEACAGIQTQGALGPDQFPRYPLQATDFLEQPVHGRFQSQFVQDRRA